MCEETKATVNGSLGKGDHNTWQPWSYQKRLEVAAKVAERKQQLQDSTYAESTKRKKVLDFIKDQKSRQEFEPIIGKIIDFGYAEPLHIAFFCLRDVRCRISPQNTLTLKTRKVLLYVS